MSGLKKRDYLIPDMIALVCGAVLFAYLAVTAKRSIGLLDEAFYYTVPQRILLGDRFFAEEWHLTQLAFIFDIIPVWLFTAVKGSTEGLILFMRYLFLAVDACYYVFMYVRLRRFRYAGVLAALLFCGLLPQGVCALCYYTVSAMAVMTLCLRMLSDSNKTSARVLFLDGLVLACAVLAEPFLLFGVILWFVAVLLRELIGRKRSFLPEWEFILSRRTLTVVLSGAFAVFAVFMIYMAASGTLGQIPGMLPYLFMDRTYGSANLFGLSKIADAAAFFGAVPLAGLCLSFAAAVIYALNGKQNRVLRLAAFAAGCIFLAVCCVHGAYAANYLLTVEFHDAPVLIWAPTVCILLKERNRRLNALLLTGLLYSLFVDLASANVLGSGGRIVFVAGAIGFSSLIKEIVSDLPMRKQKKVPGRRTAAAKWSVCALAAVCGLFFAAWNLGFVYIEGMLKPQDTVFFEGEDALSTQTLTQGPYKGIVTNVRIADRYEKTLRDLDRIKEMAPGATVAVPDRLPYAYLYLGMPYGAHSAWVSADYDMQLAAYWSVRPEKRPACIYVPYYNTFTFEDTDKQNRLSMLAQYLTYEIIEGETGYILRVTD